MARNLSRNTKLIVSTVGAGVAHTPANSFEVPPLDGYSFSQDTATQEIGVSEAGTAPVRGQRSFNTAINPVDVSFTSYVRPFKLTNHDAIERVLWGALVSADATGTTAVSRDTTRMQIDFTDSNRNQLDKLYLYFIFDDVAYRIDEVVINTAEFSFDIEGITQVTWGGLGASINEDYDARDNWVSGVNYLPATDIDGAGKRGEFIQNKLTTLTITDNRNDGIADKTAQVASSISTTTPARPVINTGAGVVSNNGDYVGGFIKYTSGAQAGNSYTITASTTTSMTLLGPFVGSTPAPADEFSIYEFPSDHVGTEYIVPITGGSISISNNVTFLTPEELGVVNTPIDHFTGTRAISGSVTAYLNTGHANTAGILNLLANDLGTVNNSFEILLSVGGPVAPKVEFEIGTAQLSIPSVITEDIMSTEISFIGQGSTGLEATDELVVRYFSSQ